MKPTELGEARSIGDWMRWFVLAALIAAIAIPTVRYEPWKKIDVFATKVTTGVKK